MKYTLILLLFGLVACGRPSPETVEQFRYIHNDERALNACVSQGGRLSNFQMKNSGNYSFECTYETSNDGL